MIKPKLIVLTGTTATGKTSQALKLAQELGGELISADSRQCYKHLDIITGKDFEQNNYHQEATLKGRFELGYYTIQGVPVWLYDVLDPKEYFSAHDWANCAKAVVKNILQRHKLPIIGGGSYLYLQTLLFGTEKTGEANWPLRHQLELVELAHLQVQLQKLNPELFERLNDSDRQNKRRLIRWIEKLVLSKNDLGFKTLQKPWANGFVVDFRGRRFFCKEELAQKIAQRVRERLAAGALSEVEILLSMGYQKSDPGLQTIGYRQLLKHLEGECSLQEAVKEWETKEVQYAKRQLTFMKKNPQIVWEIL